MKKTLLFLTAITAVALASCSKKNSNDPNPENPVKPTDTTAVDTTISLIGTWNTTSRAYSAVYFFYRDGTFCDSTSSPLENMHFTFIEGNKVETPWEMTSSYIFSDSQLIIDMVANVKRVYYVSKLAHSCLIMEHLDTAEYYSGNDTLLGYEVEHWDLQR